MKIEELGAGLQDTLRVRPLNPQDTAGPGEVQVILPQDTDTVGVAVGTRVVTVEPDDEDARRILERYRELRPATLARLVKITRTGTATRWLLELRRFSTAIRLNHTLSIAVDQRIVEAVGKRNRSSMNVDAVCAWLKDEVALAPRGDDPLDRVVSTGDPNGRLRLLGRSVSVDLDPQEDGRLVVRSVTGRRADRTPPTTLLEVQLAFQDGTLEGAGRSALRAEIEQLVRSADSYVGLWLRYQRIEQRLHNQRRRELGFVSYDNLRRTPHGEWVFEGIEPGRLEAFAAVLETQGIEHLEAAAAPPAVLTEPDNAEPDHAEPAPLRPSSPRQTRRARRVPVGHVAGVDPRRGRLTLRPLDEDAPVDPPSRGVLFASLNGDLRRLERREDAITRLHSGTSHLPQLVHILEGQPAPVRRVDHLRPTSAASLRNLSHPLTPAQRRALDVALNTPDLALIQGPPGTGKTTVISALLARLAEVNADLDRLGGRTLLTSYQHDAVDNAVGVSRVLGLPPVRFGGRQQQRTDLGQSPENLTADRWARGLTEHLRALPCDTDSLLSQYRVAVGQVTALLASPPDRAALRRVVTGLLSLPEDALPLTRRDALRALLQPPPMPSAPSFERQRQERAIRGLRVTRAAFDDDGPARAAAALHALRDLLSPGDHALLHAAADLDHPFNRLNELDAVQGRLLDAFAVAPLPREPLHYPSTVTDTLHETLRALERTVRRSPGEAVDAVDELIDALEHDPEGVRATLHRYAAVYAATCQQAVSFQVVRALQGLSDGDPEVENVVVDEAARANPLDLFIPMSMGRRRIILVGDHRQLPHMLEPDVERELAGTVDDACQRNLKSSLFERLFNDLQAREASDGVKRVVTLDQQFRMHPTLGDFVGRAFYAPHHEPYHSPRPADHFHHDLQRYAQNGRPRCAVWKSIAYSRGPELSGRSRSRPEEARWIAKEIKGLLDAGCTLTIGAISFYRAQVNLLMEELARVGVTEHDPETGAWSIRPEYAETERDGRIEERLRVGTVDAFQGKEFDLVFLSVTRSNLMPARTEEERRRRWGHLMLPNRLCVAMSRQRRLLIAVGDDAMARGPDAAEAVPALSTFLDLCQTGEDGMIT